MGLLEGFATMFASGAVFAAVLGAFAGLILGAIPGLTSTMALAILAPLTFGFDPIYSICFLMGIYVGGIAGGSIPAVALNIPGTPASAATAIDGYPLMKKGLGERTIKMSFLAATIGGLFSGLILINLAPVIAKFGLRFSAPEYFALGMLGIAIIISISGKNMLRGLIVAIIGFAIATIGVDAVSGQVRFTFGMPELTGGISYVPALIGLFGLSEVFYFNQQVGRFQLSKKVRGAKREATPAAFKMKRLWGTLLRSSGIGTLVGSIPGAGADIASWASYDVATRTAKKGDKFGKGEIKGVVASESANNANVGGALIPMLTFGIPGDGQTAMLIAFLLIQGIEPGPLLFQNNADFIWVLFAAVLLTNVLVTAMGYPLTRPIIKLVSQPTRIIYPAVVLFCVVGAYAVNNSFFDIIVMVVFGLVGFIMKKWDFPIAPLMLALILAPMIESNLRRGLVMYDGDFLSFFQRPIFLVIVALGILMTVSTLWLQRKSLANVVVDDDEDENEEATLR